MGDARAACAASKPSAKPPSAMRSKRTPRRARFSIAAGPRGRSDRRSQRRRARRRQPSCRRREAQDCRPPRAPPPSRPAPRASSLRRRAGAFEQDDDRPRRELKRGHQTGDARADDDGASAIRAARRSQREHPLDRTARRRGDRRIDRHLAFEGLERAADILGSVMRFICGQSAQGRTNSMSG